MRPPSVLFTSPYRRIKFIMHFRYRELPVAGERAKDSIVVKHTTYDRRGRGTIAEATRKLLCDRKVVSVCNHMLLTAHKLTDTIHDELEGWKWNCCNNFETKMHCNCCNNFETEVVLCDNGIKSIIFSKQQVAREEKKNSLFEFHRLFVGVNSLYNSITPIWENDFWAWYKFIHYLQVQLFRRFEQNNTRKCLFFSMVCRFLMVTYHNLESTTIFNPGHRLEKVAIFLCVRHEMWNVENISDNTLKIKGVQV